MTNLNIHLLMKKPQVKAVHQVKNLMKKKTLLAQIVYAHVIAEVVVFVDVDVGVVVVVFEFVEASA